MSAEKQVVNYWLNKKGFFTLTNVKAGNKDIDIIAISFKDDKVDKIYHLEVICSISSSVINIKDIDKGIGLIIKNKFDDTEIVKAVRETIRRFAVGETEYEKILVLGTLPLSKKKDVVEKFESKRIHVYDFERILVDVMQGIDTHYYRDDMLRSLQLVKYLLVLKPEMLARLIEKKGEDILKQHSREKFLKTLLQQEDVKKALAKADEKELIMLIKHSKLKQPEKLAKLIVEEVLGKSSKRKFLAALFEHKDIKEMFMEQPKERVVSSLEKKQRSLGQFLKGIYQQK